MKLTTKLVTSIILVAIVLITVTSYLSYTITRDALRNEIAVEQLELARQTMDKIDRLFYERLNGINVIAENATIIQYINQSQTLQNANSTSTLQLLLKRTIEKLELTTGPWNSIDILNKDGTVVYSTSVPPNYTNINSNPIAKPMIGSVLQGNPAYSDVYLNKATNKPTMLFLAPIRDETDPTRPIVGMAASYLSWPVVLEILQSTNTYKTTLFNTKGIEIGDNNFNNTDDVMKTRGNLGQGFADALSGKEESLIVSTNNSQTLTSYALEKGFLDYHGNGWILTVETPASVAFAPAFRTATTIILWLLLIIIAVSVSFVLFIIRALRPLQVIGNTAQEIAGGNLKKRVEVHNSQDEIGQLAASFNKMADTLQQLYAGLESKIVERTKQLEETKKELEGANIGLEEKITTRTKELEELKKSLESAVAQRTTELNEKVVDLEKVNKLMIDRELKMIEMKKEIEELKKKIVQ